MLEKAYMYALFDDHYLSYPFWREAGLSDLTCIHVDAHLDVSADGFTSEVLFGLAHARNRAEIDACRGNPRLPWGGLHCGNFLYPALVDGTVTTLIWVVPKEMLEGDSILQKARQNLQGWVDMTFDEYKSFRLEDGYVVGSLLGCRLVVCTCEHLPPLEATEKIALDIDVDYFIRLRDDAIWQTPQELYEFLGDLKPAAVTVATSCEGGYTPHYHRFLGQVCLDVFGKARPDAWAREVESFRRAEDIERKIKARNSLLAPADASEGEPTLATLEESASEIWRNLLDSGPDFIRPAVLARVGRQQEGEALDSSYRLSFLDLAGREFSKRSYAKGLEYLKMLKEEDSDSSYLRAFLAMGTSELNITWDQVEALLSRPGLTDKDQARLIAIQAEISSRRKDTRRSISLMEKALKLEPNRAPYYYFLAKQQRILGKREPALKALRKALRLAKGRVSSLPILLEASRVYEEMGQKAMAQASRRELEACDVTGLYAISSILDVVNR